jgi:FtsH-binding integral membrane protein
MSFYGYFTRRNLDTLGQYLFVGLIAVVIASIINVFLGSSTLGMVVSALAIIVFMGLTAYDTQTIREMVSENDATSIEILGALSLYLNFINIFLSLLSLFGGKRE